MKTEFRLNIQARLFFILLLIVNVQSLQAQIKTTEFEFQFEGNTLNGIINSPDNDTSIGMVVFVHGSGETQAVENEWYYDIRERLVQIGFSTYMYDKKGCGKSTGVFDYNQSVQNSSLEVITAINKLKEQNIAGSEDIGLVGFSRAGWINPLVINQYEDIRFWISVSGTDDKENFGYLLEENLRIDGLPGDSVNLIVNEWYRGNQISYEGGTYEEAVAATQNLTNSAFMKRFRNGNDPTKKGFLSWQKKQQEGEVDPETGLFIYVPNFEQILNEVNIPVLAIFGEMDKNVDWTKTSALYKNTMGKNTDLTIKTFPGCGHNLFKTETGGFFELRDKQEWIRCAGFLDEIDDWLEKKN